MRWFESEQVQVWEQRAPDGRVLGFAFKKHKAQRQAEALGATPVFVGVEALGRVTRRAREQ